MRELTQVRQMRGQIPVAPPRNSFFEHMGIINWQLAYRALRDWYSAVISSKAVLPSTFMAKILIRNSSDGGWWCGEGT